MTNANVLIVEDEGILAIELKEKLERLCYNVPSIASSGEEAIEMALRYKPDLILMDIVLKGEMDGIGAANKIRSILKVPVIYLTAYADNDTVNRAKTTEPFGYLIKPYNEKELQIALEMALYKHTMEKLRESHHWLETVLKSMGDAVIATDNDGNITFVNPSAERLTGLKNDDAVGLSLDEVVRIIDEESWNPVKNLVGIALSKNSAAASSVSNLLSRPDGKDVTIEYIASPIADVQGTVMGVVLILKDLTSQREAEIESKIRDTAMASSINALCITDTNGKIKYVNAPFYELWGYSSEEVIGKSASEISRLYAELSEIETSLREKGRWNGETAAIRKDGTKFFAKLSVNNIYDRLGRPVYMAYSFVDITNLKKAQEELKKYITKLQRTDVRTDELAEELSRNFKLSYELLLRLYTLLSNDPAIKDGEIAKCLAETKESIDAVGNLVEELELCSLPYSLYLSLIALYQLKVEDIGKEKEV
ncbi:Chemotaxis protein CheY [uncultured archaeon]|nr:Chemotaxis protein CheY [uncultured archaeon]